MRRLPLIAAASLLALSTAASAETGVDITIYAERDQVHVETEVTFEDGRKGRIEADLVIRDTSAHQPLRRAA